MVQTKEKQTAFVAILFLVVCHCLTVLGFSDSQPAIMCLFFFLGTTILLSQLLKSVARERSDIYCFWISYIIKIGYALYRFTEMYGMDMVSPKLSTDARRFWNQAKILYNGKNSHPETNFPYVLNFEFNIFGQNLLCFLLLNIALTMLMMIFVIKLLNKLEIRGNGKLIALAAVGMLPYEVIVSCSVLRESIYFVFIIISFYLYYLYIKSGEYKYMMMSILIMLPVILLHVGYFPIIFVYLWDSFRKDKIKTAADLLLRLFVIGVFLGVVVVSLRNDSDGAGYVSRGITGLINKITGESNGTYSDEAGSRYLADLKIDSVPTLILYTPIRWVYFLLSPLPTNWRGISDIAAFFLDGCVHLYVMYSTYKAIKLIKTGIYADENAADNKRLLSIGLSIIVLIALVFSLNTNTAGTAIRHRDVLIGIEAILFGLSYKIRTSGVKHEADDK